jgi:hypothetical protein
MVTVTDRRAEIVLHQEASKKRTQHSLDTHYTCKQPKKCTHEVYKRRIIIVPSNHNCREKKCDEVFLVNTKEMVKDFTHLLNSLHFGPGTLAMTSGR